MAADRSPVDRVYYTARHMAMGTREPEQDALWVATSDLPKSPAAGAPSPIHRIAGRVFDPAIESMRVQQRIQPGVKGMPLPGRVSEVAFTTGC